jgi:hypothetical protein
MHVLAALADAPTAALAVAAILLGLFVLARGQRGEDGDEEAGSSLLRVPVVVPASAAQAGDGADQGDAGEGLQTMPVGQVGHGAIRLGPVIRPAPEPPATAQPPAPIEPGPQPDDAAPVAAMRPAPEPQATPEPDRPLDPPVSWSAQPAPPRPPAQPEPPLDPPTTSSEPLPAPAVTPESPPPAPDAPPVPFRQGRIRLRKPPE